MVEQDFSETFGPLGVDAKYAVVGGRGPSLIFL